MKEVKIKLLKEMHEYILNIDNDDIYAEWIVKGVPDYPTRNDFEYIAENEELFINVSMLFMELIKEG